MSTNTRQSQHRMLKFAVPGLANLSFVVPIQQVITITTALPVSPLPLMPPYIAGLCEWSAQIVTVIDLARLLHPTDGREEASTDPTNMLIVQMSQDRQLVAWSVLAGASSVEVPTMLPSEPAPQGLDSKAFYAVVRLNNDALIVLDIEQLPLS